MTIVENDWNFFVSQPTANCLPKTEADISKFLRKNRKSQKAAAKLKRQKKQQEQQQCKAQTKFMHFEKFLTTPRGAL